MHWLNAVSWVLSHFEGVQQRREGRDATDKASGGS